MSTLTVDLFSGLDGFGGAEGWPGYYGKERSRVWWRGWRRSLPRTTSVLLDISW
jgi:hypothetical protein